VVRGDTGTTIEEDHADDLKSLLERLPKDLQEQQS
jgi:hypothetical protein